jgi:hypothetical protein
LAAFPDFWQRVTRYGRGRQERGHSERSGAVHAAGKVDPEEHMSQNHMRSRIAYTLLTACVGLVMIDATVRQSARDGGAPMQSAARSTKPQPTEGSSRISSVPPAILSRQGTVGATFSHGEDDDQPAGACWLASGGGAPASCLCSAGSIEDLMTPDFMRGLLTSWRDAGVLTTGEWQVRLHEVDAACGPREVAP